MEFSQLREAFGHIVRASREGMGLSQQQLANRADLHRTYVGSVERGERNVSLENIAALAEALDTSPSEILRQAEELVRG